VGKGSGGKFAVGEYRQGDHPAELHFRWTLEIVNYWMGDHSPKHHDYMRLLGVADQTDYPGFSDNPVDGFRHLRSDLERFGKPFLSGKERSRFAHLVKEAKEARSRLRPLP